MPGKKTFNVNDFVWAKVTGYPYWPAVVMEPHPESVCKSKKESYWLYFFGSRNYAWVNVKFIKPYEENKNKMLERCTESISNANKELSSNKRKLINDPNYQIDVIPFIVKEKKNRAKRSRSRSTSAASVRSRASSVASRASSINSTKSGKVRSICLDGPSPKRFRREEEDEGFHKLLITKHMETTWPTVGILICNLFGEAAARNLIRSKHNVVCWSPSRPLCKRLAQYSQTKNQYFKVYGSARHVAQESSVILSFMSTETELNSMYIELGLTNSSDNLMSGKAFVEMSQMVKFDNIFEITSDMQKKSVRYLAAMVQGTKRELEDRKAVLLIGGDAKDVTKELKMCFLALAKESRFVGSFDKTVKLHVAHQSIKAMMLASLTETLAAVNLKTQNIAMFLIVFKKLDLYNQYLGQKTDVIWKKTYNDIQEDYNSNQPCLRNALATSNKWSLPLTHTSETNQIFKNARRLGLEDKDISSLYLSM